jgi:hypothetical protein
MQNLFKKNPAKAAREVISGKWKLNNPEESFSETCLLESWKEILGSPSLTDNSPVTMKSEVFDELDHPIQDIEVRNELKRLKSSASGPDGYLLRDVLQLEHFLLTTVFNLCIFLNTMSAQWKSARTILIPKSAEPESTSDFRPIKFLHKVLAHRIELRLPLNL